MHWLDLTERVEQMVKAFFPLMAIALARLHERESVMCMNEFATAMIVHTYTSTD